MKEINLKDIYPHYEKDHTLLVDDMVAELLETTKRAEQTYQRKTYRYKAHYSLDCQDGIEALTLNSALSPHEIYERKELFRALYDALKLLPPLQARRIYAHYILNMSKSDIARCEGVSVRAVCTCIQRGLEVLGVVLGGWV